MIREGVARALKELLNVEEVPFNVPPKREEEAQKNQDVNLRR